MENGRRRHSSESFFFCLRSRSHIPRESDEQDKRVHAQEKRTRRRRIFLIRLSRSRFTFHTGGKKIERKDLFLLPRFCFVSFFFCFIVYDFFYFLSLFFFSATHKTRASFILFPSRHVFTLVRHPPYNITLINVLIRTLSIFSWFQLILLLQATPFANSWFSPSYRHHHRHAAHAGKHHRTRSLTNLYFQASLYTNYFINILLISVPHNLNIT